MAKRRRTDNTMAKRRRTDNNMAKRKRPKGQKTIYKTLHRKIKNIVFFFFLNEPFAHSLYDSNILHFYTSYFLYDGKMVPVLARVTKRTKKLRTIFL
jgi:hypothetical protein